MILVTKRGILFQKQIRFMSTFSEVDTAQYYFENGLRKVKPYYYYFHTFAKKRMIGRTVLSNFLTEYRGRSEDYYKYAIDHGFVTVNGDRIDYNQTLKLHDQIVHKVHRHEPPVTNQPIQIIHEDKELLVIDKPSGIQVHPSGRYRHNTVAHIMMKEMGHRSLYPINRLDTLTSGLMFFAKTSEKANGIMKEIREREVDKEYICRVSGYFPSGRIECDAPIKQLSFLVPLNYVHSTGKPCSTVFERISYDGETSLVKCQPLTGRTHQIRVHLRYLGFPIANDPVYGFSTPWSNLFPLGSLEDPEEIVRLMVEYTPFDYMMDPFRDSSLPRCQECHVPIVEKDLASLTLWLHAVKYNGDNWSYKSSLPSWAR
ncbi:pseudouridine synthase [Sporodiniella umbellata]|nr:pseudouridine synthase [Sporodiniella umbellata]